MWWSARAAWPASVKNCGRSIRLNLISVRIASPPACRWPNSMSVRYFLWIIGLRNSHDCGRNIFTAAGNFRFGVLLAARRRVALQFDPGALWPSVRRPLTLGVWHGGDMWYHLTFTKNGEHVEHLTEVDSDLDAVEECARLKLTTGSADRVEIRAIELHPMKILTDGS